MQDNDLISRQAAINACLKGKMDGLPATNVAGDCCAERIRVLSSAHSNTSNTLESLDCIDRQAALDALKRAEALTRAFGYHYVIDTIQELPSAQPKIIRCNSCKHWTQTIGEMRGFGLGICDFHNAEYVTCNGFCYWAERREGEQDDEVGN